MNRAGPPGAALWFAERYGREPEGIWFAPGRAKAYELPDAGAAGARMTGGGFGGSVVALVPADQAGRVRRAITGRFTQHHWPAPALSGRGAL